MLAFLNALFGGIIGFLNNLLPGNPFDGMLQVTQDMALGLGWLNWFVPLQGMVAMATIWLMSCLAVVGVKLALNSSKKMMFDLPTQGS